MVRKEREVGIVCGTVEAALLLSVEPGKSQAEESHPWKASAGGVGKYGAGENAGESL